VQLRVYDGKDWNLRLRDDTNIDRLVVQADDGPSGGPVALALQTSLPYTPGEEEAVQIQIDAEGADTIRVISPPADPPADTTVLQANLNMPAGDEAVFYTVNSAWSLVSRSHDNPVQDTDSPTFVVQRTSDGKYFQIEVEFTGAPAISTLTIDALSAWRCGGDPGDCP
jgi:hypothetical protein